MPAPPGRPANADILRCLQDLEVPPCNCRIAVDTLLDDGTHAKFSFDDIAQISDPRGVLGPPSLDWAKRLSALISRVLPCKHVRMALAAGSRVSIDDWLRLIGEVGSEEFGEADGHGRRDRYPDPPSPEKPSGAACREGRLSAYELRRLRGYSLFHPGDRAQGKGGGGVAVQALEGKREGRAFSEQGGHLSWLEQEEEEEAASCEEALAEARRLGQEARARTIRRELEEAWNHDGGNDGSDGSEASGTAGGPAAEAGGPRADQAGAAGGGHQGQPGPVPPGRDGAAGDQGGAALPGIARLVPGLPAREMGILAPAC
jgi:hypothetical protein